MKIKWSIVESIAFLLFVLANAYIVFAFRFFPTLDGAPHLYNSHCINEILQGNEYLKGFMQWNPFPNPNWTGHFIMSFVNLLFPAWIAEKTFLMIYMIGFPYGFRYLIKTLSPKNFPVSYLIFPFCYTFMLYLGFYNFSISIVFLFFTIGFWIRSKDKLNIFRTIILFLLVTATYFSHVSIYGILFPMLFGLLFIDETLQLFAKKHPFKAYFRSMAIKTGVLLLSFSITAWWTFQFLTPRPSSIPQYLPDAEMFINIKIIQPIIGLVQVQEKEFTAKMFYVLVFLALVVIAIRVTDFIKGFGFSKQIIMKKLQSIVNKGDLWLAFALVFMAGYYILPDSDNWAGYFSLRMLLLFFLMFLVWLGTQKIPKMILIPAVALLLFFHIQLTIYRYTLTETLNNTALQCCKASEFMRENTTLFPLNVSGNWLYGHFDKYIGIDKAVVILENNECNQNYFPLVWNKNKAPHMYLDETGALDSCYSTSFNGNKYRQKIDYFFILGQPDTNKICEKKLYWFFKTKCKTAYTDGFVSLYEIK